MKKKVTIDGAVYAAIGLALHELADEVHVFFSFGLKLVKKIRPKNNIVLGQIFFCLHNDKRQIKQ